MGGAADVAHFAGADEVVEGAKGLVLGYGQAGPVQLVEVDAVGLEPAQRVLTGFDDVIARDAPVIRPLAHLAVDLGGQNDFVAPAVLFEGAADELLAFAVVVDIGSIDEVDAPVQGAVDNLYRFFAAAWIGEVHGPQAQRGDLYAGST